MGYTFLSYVLAALSIVGKPAIMKNEIYGVYPFRPTLYSYFTLKSFFARVSLFSMEITI